MDTIGESTGCSGKHITCGKLTGTPARKTLLQNKPLSGCSKFTISIPDIAHYIPEAFHKEPGPIAGSLNYQRCFDTGTITGFTREGTTTTFITVITERGEPSLLPPRGTISHNTELAFTDFISSATFQTF
ncbi:hypothetical protein FW778_15590 [Ginsengibacter hankyongi]|uniref:Uncharacterized protein n=1 Tax=Ginsengibacter hankyongi TaxID=2607284 RepID=A0A5J5IEY1_9BACT|nr:hypothetical protein [Ginsengibacter hankyongi]KAA9038173.1 hypothetical protein FW778_15590 [Ginsengibacter hankyongi]